jgi:hypothetical protein
MAEEQHSSYQLQLSAIELEIKPTQQTACQSDLKRSVHHM